MIGSVVVRGRRGRDEAEKPFWISYSDLMTALMVLFLVVMSVALLAVTKTVDEAAQQAKERSDAIEGLLNDLEKVVATDPEIRVDKDRHTIEFGDRARFADNRAELSAEKQRKLREFVPGVLQVASTDKGRRWLKRVVVEGYTSRTGDYLYNLNLSLQRSQRFLCSFFAPPMPDETPLPDELKAQIRSLFIVGGYSANMAKATEEESRRVELRLEFYGLDPKERSDSPPWPNNNFGNCALR